MTRRTLTKIADLVEIGLVPPRRAAALERVAERFAVAITPAMVDLIDREDPADPIARQFVPDSSELVVTPEERADPIGDEKFSPVKGIVHRYPDRVLLKPIHVCPAYCRFCFRREQVGPRGAALSAAELTAALAYIKARPEIWEVIVTGGDPFLLSPRRLAALVKSLDAIAQLGAIRFHTRVPVLDPGRIDDRLARALAAEKAVYVAVHVNHPREVTPAFRAACKRLAKGGAVLLAQTVLLRGVNDDARVLEALFRALVAARVKPYYLHHPDLARGTGRFRLGLAEGRALVGSLRGRISGLCQPTYVLDLPGGAGKVPVGESHARPGSAPGTWEVTDYRGRRQVYPPEADSRED